MIHLTHRTATLVLAGLAALSLAACSSDTAGTGSTPSVTADGGAAPATDDKAAERFRDCLVDQGVDATVQMGKVVIPAAMSTGDDGVPSIQENDTSAEQAVCEAEVPEYTLGVGLAIEDDGSVVAPDLAVQEAAAMAFSTCVQENGFPDFSDPEDGAIALPESLTAEQLKTLYFDTCAADTNASVGFYGRTPHQQELVTALMADPRMAAPVGRIG